jgi:restriction system protein
MTIPDYQSIMAPLLRLAGSKPQDELAIKDAYKSIAREFKITDQELNQLLASRGQPVFHIRVNWASTYLKKAGLLESTRRGYIKITQRGLYVLSMNPQTINNEFLLNYPEFAEFYQRAK